MKKQTFTFLMVILFCHSFLLMSQEDVNNGMHIQAQSVSGGSHKGEFHIGIQNFALTNLGDRSVFVVNPRIGYMVSNLDMIYLDVNYLQSLDIFKSLETNLNYRRYLCESKFQPFIQAGLGYGFANWSESPNGNEYRNNYFTAKTGIGVSYRYKRWAFEVGMQYEYNSGSSGRIDFKPMFGVSFSF